MAKKKELVHAAPPPSEDSLNREICTVVDAARDRAHRAINAEMVPAYWHVGRLIVEHAQSEVDIEELSHRLKRHLGPVATTDNLRQMRRFYLAFPGRHAPGDDPASMGKQSGLHTKSTAQEKRAAVFAELGVVLGTPPFRPDLSWAHYLLLLDVEDPEARERYMKEAADQHWSTDQLAIQLEARGSTRPPSQGKKGPARKKSAAKPATAIPKKSIRGRRGSNS